ncbi:restriction endonuclease subunit S [Aliarcobacter thereius]|uniref:Type-1 restriction enzyme EcoKI specificity protein n=1 Tax=Aliarcobacter thereius LMG 24486 TaxID=1032240 RepID=A0A1C7WR64_9BACT|nr:restriction endonuclease subunit S [Aliarcobacter thereius]OCL95773.1 Type-1 restriction enzyme EcoKI specificity protein [Aliarcobacter thereius LMG 24486]QBF16253.1 type I restriction/modification system, S subunit [Aliarcobacter thereius LMG 24486]TLS92123.1 restriction endonuclease subunit S [Aliarcobacter thereius]
MKYKKYPSYKDSGVEWLGEIPSDWNESRLKFIGYTYGGLSGKAGKDFGDEENLKSKRFIPFTNIANNTFIKSDNLGYVIVDEKEEQNRVKANDLFFLMSSENYDDLGKASLLEEDLKDTYLNSFCKGFRLTNKLINPKFLNYLLSGNIYRKLLSIQGNGFTRINLRLEKLNELKLLLPNLREQQQIANFLDKATAKIDTLIEKQTKQIELLKEKRQAVISHAVTKGINPNVPMKDSGVEWLGEIPEHWEVSKLRFLFSFSTGLNITKANLIDEDGIPCVNYGEIHSKYGFQVNANKDSLKYVDKEYLITSKRSLLSEGDFVFADTSEDVKGSGNFTHVVGDSKIFAGYHTVIARLINNYNSRFFAYIFDSNIFRTQIQLSIKGVKVFSITQAILKNCLIWFPVIEEQQQIANYLDEKTSKIDALIEKSNKSIELLKEKRTALISAAVTGKIDVREFE